MSEAEVYCRRCNVTKPETARFCDTCGSGLITRSRSLQGPVDEIPSDQLLGHTLAGAYRVDSVISRGTTSCVYRGMNLRLNQTVAIKVLARHLAGNSSLMSRFEAEARVQAKRKNSLVSRVLDDPENGVLLRRRQVCG